MAATNAAIEVVNKTTPVAPAVKTKKTLSGTNLLYPEGLPSTIPDTSADVIDIQNMTEDERITRNRRFFNFVPTVLISENRLSTTSSARDCYVYRRNSRRLQETLIDYSYNLTRMFNITQEV